MLFIKFENVKNLNMGLSKNHDNCITSGGHYIYCAGVNEIVDIIISRSLVFNYSMSVKGEQII